MDPERTCMGHVCRGVFQPCCRKGCRKVLVVTVLVVVMFFPLLVHHNTLERLRVELVWWGTEDVNQIPTAPPSLLDTVGREDKAKILPRKDTPKKKKKDQPQGDNQIPTAPPSVPDTVGRESKDTPKKKKNDQPLDDIFKNMVVFKSWPPKVKFPLMAFTNAGRLGNRLNSYATSLVFQAVHPNTTVATTPSTVKYLTTLLDPSNLNLPLVEKSLMDGAKKNKSFIAVGPKSSKDLVSQLEPAFQRAEREYKKNGKPKVFALGGYPNRMWMLADHLHIIRAAYRFREDLKEKAENFFEQVRQQKGRRDITFVGFHIRRTDYTKVSKTYYECPLPGPPYYESALNYYRKTLQNPVFVVATDDRPFARKHLEANEDVVFSDMKKPAEDMALLGSCSHSIMTVGSFAFWSSFFAGGQVVYPLLINCSVTPFVHPDTLGPRGYENFIPFDRDGGGPV